MGKRVQRSAGVASTSRGRFVGRIERAPDTLPFEFFFHVLNHYAYPLHCFPQFVWGYVQFSCPVFDLVGFIYIDPVAVAAIAVGFIVRHTEITCDCLRTVLGVIPDPQEARIGQNRQHVI